MAKKQISKRTELIKKDLMLDKATIQKAIEESIIVKEKYPAFWRFHCMLLDLNEGLIHLERSFKEKEDEKNG